MEQKRTEGKEEGKWQTVVLHSLPAHFHIHKNLLTHSHMLS